MCYVKHISHFYFSILTFNNRYAIYERALHENEWCNKFICYSEYLIIIYPRLYWGERLSINTDDCATTIITNRLEDFEFIRINTYYLRIMEREIRWAKTFDAWPGFWEANLVTRRPVTFGSDPATVASS